MPNVKLRVVLPTGAIREVEVPADVRLDELVPELVVALQVTSVGPDGRPIGYRLLSGERLLRGEETLATAGVRPSDELLLQPDITAGCFLCGTQVSVTMDSSVPIESLSTGDRILTRGRDGQLTAGVVEYIYRGSSEGFYVVNGHMGVTGTHPIMTKEGWKPVSKLNVGDIILSLGGEVKLHSLKPVTLHCAVYNLDVSEDGVFFANGFQVHNFSGKLGYDDILKDHLKSALPKHRTAGPSMLERLGQLSEQEGVSSSRNMAIRFLFVTYGLMVVSTLAIIFLKGFHLAGFDINDSFLQWLGAAVIGEVAGLLALVYGALFKM